MELEATPAEEEPSPHEMNILAWQDSCERSMHEDTSKLGIFDNSCAIREWKLQAGVKDDHPYMCP
eukprot:2756489-Pyramimonas_sp.AAC.1